MCNKPPIFIKISVSYIFVWFFWYFIMIYNYKLIRSLTISNIIWFIWYGVWGFEDSFLQFLDMNEISQYSFNCLKYLFMAIFVYYTYGSCYFFCHLFATLKELVKVKIFLYVEIIDDLNI